MFAPFKGTLEENCRLTNHVARSDGKHSSQELFQRGNPFRTHRRWIGREGATKRSSHHTFLEKQKNSTIHRGHLYDSVPADFIEKAVSMPGKMLYQTVSSRPAPKIVLKDAWQKSSSNSSTSKAHQQSAGTRLRGKIHSKLISEFKEFHKMQCFEDQGIMTKFQENWWTSCRLNTKTEPIVANLRKGNSTGSMKNHNVQFQD